MKLVILESPYSGNIKENIKYARSCIRDCLSKNESPIASHLLFTQQGILIDEIEWQRDIGIEAGLAWYAVAQACVVYIDHGFSRGMVHGMARARKNGVEIIERRLYKTGEKIP